MQYSCTLCVEHTIGLEIGLDAPMELRGDVGNVKLLSVRLEMVLVSVQDRCTVCAKCTIGLEIDLDAPDGTRRL